MPAQRGRADAVVEIGDPSGDSHVEHERLEYKIVMDDGPDSEVFGRVSDEPHSPQNQPEHASHQERQMQRASLPPTDP